MSVATDLVAIADALIGRGVTQVVTDPARINPPCVLVDPAPGLDYRVQLLNGEVAATWKVHIIGQGVGDAATAADLYGRLPDVVDALAEDWDVTTVQPGSYVAGGYPTGDPARYPCLTVTCEGITQP